MSRSSTAIALLSLLVAAHGRPLPVCTLNPSTALHATVKHVVGYSEEAKAQNGGAMMPCVAILSLPARCMLADL